MFLFKKSKFLALIILLFQIIKIKLEEEVETAKNPATRYKIFASSNNYPRPLLLSNGDVLALSGDPGKMSRYNKNAELIYSDINIPNYEPNAAIKQFTDDLDGNNRFILVEGFNIAEEGNGTMNIFLLNDKGLIKKTQYDDAKVHSYKIDIYILNDNLPLISFVKAKDNKRWVQIQKYSLDSNNDFKPVGTLIEVETTNNYISCAQGNNYICCMYITGNCVETSLIIKNDLSSKNSVKIYDAPDCPFDKIVWLKDNRFVFTFQKEKIIRYAVKDVKNDNEYQDVLTNYNDDQLLKDCQKNTMKTDATKFTDDTFVISCVTSSNLAHIEVVTVKGNNKETKNIISKNAVVDFPFVSKFSDNFMSIFYNYNKTSNKENEKGDNVFEILFYPSCSDYKAGEIFINSRTKKPFSLINSVVEGTGDTEEGTLMVYFPENISAGTLKINGTETIIKAGDTQSVDTKYIFTSGFQYGDIYFQFAGKRKDKVGRYCWMIFTVKDCNEGCYTCAQYGDYYHKYCFGCNKTGGYYPVNEDVEKEAAGKTHEASIETESEYAINCFGKGSKTYEGHYFDPKSESFLKCKESCEFCVDAGSEGNHTCKSCAASYFMQIIEGHENDPGNCFNTSGIPNGYYLNGEVIQKCDISCITCESNSKNCKECNINDGYYKNEKNTSSCLKEAPSENFYKDESGVEIIWRECYSSCKTCSRGGSDSSQNCDSCVTNHYKIDGDTNNNCIYPKPTNYYLDEDSHTYKKCEESCSECFGGKTDTTMNCNGCAENYHPIIESNKDCYNEDTIGDNYYLNTKTGNYEHCNDACKKCEEYSELSDATKCKAKQCMTRYTYKSDDYTQCESITKTLEKYSLITDPSDSSNQYFQKCNEGCKTCSSGEINGCTSCDNSNDYYMKEEDLNENNYQCYYHPTKSTLSEEDKSKDEASKYYVKTEEGDPTKYYLVECFTNCKRCSLGGTAENNNCDECEELYYPKSNVEKSCANNPEGYYFDNSDNKYHPCHSNCATCTQSGDETNNNCATCKDGFTQEEQSSGLYNCVGGCPNINQAYSNTSSDKECIDCDNKLFINGLYCINCDKTDKKYHILGETQCLNEKPSNYYEENDGFGTITKCPNACATCEKCTTDCNGRSVNCLTCSSLSPIKSNNYCYANCREIDNTKPYLYNGDCYANCNAFYYLVSNDVTGKCDKCTTEKKYLLKNGNECKDSIPEGYALIDDSNYQFLYEKCYETCKSCSSVSNDPNNQKCTSCLSTYFLRIGSTNCDEKCDDTNDGYYVKDTTNRKCINCNSNSNSNDATQKSLVYHYFGVNECIERPNTGFYLVDPATGTIKNCDDSNCLLCNPKYNTDNTEIIGSTCTKCSESNHKILYDGSCVDECPNEKFGIMDNECVNCKNYNDKTMYNVNGVCVETIPSDYVVKDEDYNYAVQCNIECGTCVLDINKNIKCTSCKDPYFQKYKSKDLTTSIVTCERTCGSYLIEDKSDPNNQKCINCKDSGLYFLDGTCVTRNSESGINMNYYVSQIAGEKEYNYLKPCHSNCETCNEGPTSIKDNCASCPNDKGLLDSNCVSSCEPNRVMINKRCVNCASLSDSDNNPKYKLNDICITKAEKEQKESEGAHLIVINSDFNILSDCTSPCLSCELDDSNNQICLTCVNGFFLQPNSNECLTHCNNFRYTVRNSDKNLCENCKDSGKFYYNGDCVNKNSEFENFYEAQTEPEKTYGVIYECYTNCAKCSKGEEIIDGVLQMNCDECKSNFYHDLLPSTNCISDCGEKLGVDKSDINNKKCVNCKNYGDAPHYKLLIEDSTDNEVECIPSKIDGYYISDENYNILEPCDPSCKTCENAADYCTECNLNYISHPYSPNKCIEECTTAFWYVDDNNIYKCSENCNSIIDSRRPNKGGNQCVNKCNDNECVFCKNTHSYYVYNNNCVNACPNGYTVGSDSYTCQIEVIDENKCNTQIEPLRRDVKIESLFSATDEWIDNYLRKYNNDLVKNVDILFGKNITLQIFKDDNCQYESSVKNGISYVNITDCKNILMNEHSLNENEILFAKYDINRTLMVNQVHYSAYNALTKEELDISICGKEEVLYKFNTSNINYQEAKDLYEKYGVDVFNANDTFFNDICVQYYDEFEHDVILSDRRKFIFQNISLCEKNCEYLGYDWEKESIRCKCDLQMDSLSKVSELSYTVNSGTFNGKIKQGSIDCIKCYKLVFSFKHWKKNAGNFVMLFFIAFQAPALVHFLFFSGFKQVYAFLNQFTYEMKGNPPKKKNNQNTEVNKKISSITTSTIKFNQINLKENSNDTNSYDNNDNSNSNNSDSNNNPQEIKVHHQSYNTISRNNFTTVKNSSEQDSIDLGLQDDKRKRHSKSNLTKNKLKLMEQEKIIHIKEGLNSGIFINSSNVLQEKIIKENQTDAEVESFDDDEIDYLKLNDAIEFDQRKFIYFLLRMCKKKIIFIRPITEISVFESFPLKIVILLFYLAWYFVFVCIFYKDKYFGKRYYTKKYLNLGYILSHELGISVLSAFIASIIGFLFDYLIVVQNKFVILIRYEKNQEQLLLKLSKQMKNYKLRILIFFGVNITFMFFFWYYISSFCAVFPKTQWEMIIITVIAFIFGALFQFIFALIITGLRFIGLKYKEKYTYKISQVLL